MHDALAGVAHREVDDAELGGVLAQHLDLAGRDGVGNRLVDVGRGHVVVFRGDGEVGAAHTAARKTQAVERLRAGDLVHEVQVDVEQVGFAGRAVDEVALPHLLRQGHRVRHGFSNRALALSHMVRYDSQQWKV